MRVLAVVAAVLLGVSARGEVVAPAAGAVDAELRRMASAADVIFAGQVLAVRSHAVAGAMGSGWVEVEFRVEEAIRGCGGRPTYVLKEWAGLWTGGRQRYAVGQRALVMLHAPSAAGLSSPVGGQDGVIPLAGAGEAPGPEDRGAGAVERKVDLRWVQARVERPAALGMGAGASSDVAVPERTGRREVEAKERERLSGLLGRVAGAVAHAPGVVEETAQPSPSVLTEGISLRSILSLLRAWEAERSDGHP
jgi:hypothetical protein